MNAVTVSLKFIPTTTALFKQTLRVNFSKLYNLHYYQIKYLWVFF